MKYLNKFADKTEYNKNKDNVKVYIIAEDKSIIRNGTSILDIRGVSNAKPDIILQLNSMDIVPTWDSTNREFIYKNIYFDTSSTATSFYKTLANYSNGIQSITKFKIPSEITTLNRFFAMSNTNKGTSLTSVDLTALEGHEFTNLYELFSYQTRLTTVKLPSKFVTEKTTNIIGMFNQCNSLTYVDTSNWNTTNVTSYSKLFSSTKIEPINLTSFNTNKATDFSHMFHYWSGSTIVGASNINVSNATDLSYMFDGVKATSPLGISSSFSSDTQNAETMECMFANSSPNNYLDGIYNSLNTKTTTNMAAMFLKSFHHGNDDPVEITLKYNIGNVTNFSNMFDNANVKKITFSHPLTSASNKKSNINMDGMVSGSSSLEEIIFPEFLEPTSITSLNMFNGCNNLKRITCSDNLYSLISGITYTTNNGSKVVSSLTRGRY